MWLATQTKSSRNHGKARCNACVQWNRQIEEEIQRKNLEQVATRIGTYPSAAPSSENQNSPQPAKRVKQQDNTDDSTKHANRQEQVYVYVCPECKAEVRSSVATGKVTVKHKSASGKPCSRQFRVAHGHVSLQHSFCFEHTTCTKRGPDSYGVSRKPEPRQVTCKTCRQDFRVNSTIAKWMSASAAGCRQESAIQA